MGQLKLIGADAAAALESLMPVDVQGLPVGKNAATACCSTTRRRDRRPDVLQPGRKRHLVPDRQQLQVTDIAHIETHIGSRCQIVTLPTRSCWRCRAMSGHASRLVPGVENWCSLSGASFGWNGAELFITRSSYTRRGRRSRARQAHRGPGARPADPAGVKPVGLGARSRCATEAGLCLYGNDIDSTTTPPGAALNWAIQKVRRSGNAETRWRRSGRGRRCWRRSTTRPACRRSACLIPEAELPVREPAVLENLDANMSTMSPTACSRPR